MYRRHVETRIFIFNKSCSWILCIYYAFAKSSPTSSSAISAQYRLWRAGYLIGVYAAVRREPDGGVWAAGRPSVASSTAPRRGSDVLLTTLDHPGAGVARDGGGEQREYSYHVFQDSCMRAICKEPHLSVGVYPIVSRRAPTALPSQATVGAAR